MQPDQKANYLSFLLPPSSHKCTKILLHKDRSSDLLSFPACPWNLSILATKFFAIGRLTVTSPQSSLECQYARGLICNALEHSRLVRSRNASRGAQSLNWLRRLLLLRAPRNRTSMRSGGGSREILWRWLECLRLFLRYVIGRKWVLPPQLLEATQSVRLTFCWN